MEPGIMTTAFKAASTSEQLREPSRELTEDELAHVSGGSAKMSVKISPEYTRMQTTG
jgi:bacteriocin-like protein